MRLAPAIWPEGLAPKGQESLAQGLPWVSGNKRFALKGLEADAIRSRGSEVIPGVAPSGLIRVGEITRVNPGLSYFGHFGPRIGRPRALRTGAKQVRSESSFSGDRLAVHLFWRLPRLRT
jgi:hypothetical protein